MTITNNDRPLTQNNMGSALGAIQDANRVDPYMAAYGVGEGNKATTAEGLMRLFAMKRTDRQTPQSGISGGLGSNQQINVLIPNTSFIEVKHVKTLLTLTNNNTDEPEVRILGNTPAANTWVLHDAAGVRASFSMTPGNYTLTQFVTQFNNLLATANTTVGLSADPTISVSGVAPYTVTYNNTASAASYLSGYGLRWFSSGVFLVATTGPVAATTGTFVFPTATVFDIEYGLPLQPKYAILNKSPYIFRQIKDRLNGSNDDATWENFEQEYLKFRGWDRGQASNASKWANFNFNPHEFTSTFPPWGNIPYEDTLTGIVDTSRNCVIPPGGFTTMIHFNECLLAMGNAKIVNNISQPQIQYNMNGKNALALDTWAPYTDVAISTFEVYLSGDKLDPSGTETATNWFATHDTINPIYLTQYLTESKTFNLNSPTTIKLSQNGRGKELAIQVLIKSPESQGTGASFQKNRNGVYADQPGIQCEENWVYGPIKKTTFYDNTGTVVNLTDYVRAINESEAVDFKDYTGFLVTTNIYTIRFSVGDNNSWRGYQEDGGLYIDATCNLDIELEDNFPGVNYDAAGVQQPVFGSQYRVRTILIKHAELGQNANFGNLFVRK